MQKTYEPFIISSPAHLSQFAEIQRSNPWWKSLLGIDMNIPENFPRSYITNKAVPVVFFAKGELTVFERQMSFRPVVQSTRDTPKYGCLDTSFEFDILYKSILRVTRFSAPRQKTKLFDLNWVQITVDAPNVPQELLLSLTANSLQMGGICKSNDELFVALNTLSAQ